MYIEIISLLLLAVFVASEDYYDVPSYYGHFSLDYFLPNFINNSTLVKLQYHFAVDMDYNNKTVFQAVPQQHCVYQFDLLTSRLSVLVGQCNNPGNITGSIQNVQFNGVSSVVYYRPVTSLMEKQILLQFPLIVADPNCSVVDDPHCVLSAPYPTLSMNNIRLQPDRGLFEGINQTADELLYIADKMNHCIKVANLKTRLVSIVAGQCGVPGFMDGPLGYSLLNMPTNLGVSRLGVVYFFDEGNEYLRIIASNGFVKTLLLGACKYYKPGRKIGNYQLNQILCYEEWIEGHTKSATTDHFFDPNILSICKEHISQCGVN